MSLQKTLLPNGVRVLTESVPHVGSASIGLWCRTGSADELPHEAGITHLIEHMLFKGTERRTSRQIAEEIEGRGGALNAFTDKQVTCYYHAVLAEDAELSVDVLCDMILCSKLDEEELAKEKQVVIEEIRRSEDDPEGSVHDLHLQGRWKGHKLGLPIIGTKASVTSFVRQNLVDYIKRRYLGGHLVLAAAGKVDHDEVVRWAEERLGSVAPGVEETQIEAPSPSVGQVSYEKDVEQVHFCIGGEAPSIYNSDYHAAVILDAILGDGMSSRLWEQVRERRGLAYSIGSYYIGYTATGAFTIYGGTSPERWSEVQEVVHRELEMMRSDGPTEEELNRVKRMYAGSMVRSLEVMSARMRRMARNELAFEREVPIEETKAKLNAVTAKQVTDLAQRIFEPTQLSTTFIGPVQA